MIELGDQAAQVFAPTGFKTAYYLSGTEHTSGRWFDIAVRPWLLSVTESSVVLPPNQVRAMSEAHRALTAFERPRCPHCRVKMALQRASPGPIGFEHRSFECPRCSHLETVVVASDPFKSMAVGWLAGELGGSPVSHEIRNGKMIPKPATE
jgi:hypothetical protein